MRHYFPAFFAFGIFISLVSCNETSDEKANPTADQTAAPTTSSVEGSWKLVWASYNDTVADMSNHILVKSFVDGAFSLFCHDSTGKIKYAGYGTYEFQDKTYNETFLYHNNREFVGAKDWQNLEVKGDTMYMNGFSKVIIGGKEVADHVKAQEKLVRTAVK